MAKSYEDLYDYKIPKTQYSSWYKARPYCFRVSLHNGDKLSFYLPLNPSNLSISTHFSTNVISTMYGTVEEHSEQKYFDIVISGTTGMAPQFTDYYVEPGAGTGAAKQGLDNSIAAIKAQSKEENLSNKVKANGGRASYPVSRSDITLGFFSRTKALINNTVNKAVDIFGPNDKDYDGAIKGSKSGYLAFHNLYRFLLAHKKEVLGKNNNRRWNAKNHPIQFINYKDNNQYNVVIQNFQLTRSADDPMLYKYNIVMRAYGLSEINKPSGPDYDNKRKDLGLDGVTSMSVRARLTNSIGSAKGALASAVGAIKGFGS